MSNIKKEIYDALSKTPMTTAQLVKALDQSKNKIYYNLKTMEKESLVNLTTDSYHNKVYALTGKKYAQAPNVQVYLNLRRPSSDYTWQRKKYKAGTGIGTLQSSMSLF